MTDRTWRISVHEAGHAVVARLLRLPGCGEASIVEPDGGAYFSINHGAGERLCVDGGRCQRAGRVRQLTMRLVLASIENGGRNGLNVLATTTTMARRCGAARSGSCASTNDHVVGGAPSVRADVGRPRCFAGEDAIFDRAAGQRTSL
jgi:hypothetical protein